MRIVVVSVLVVCIVVAVSGCAPQSAFRSDGIPQDRYLVGGGWSISFRAPCEGNAYYVEMATRKLLETKSLGQGDDYEQSFDPSDNDDEALKALGIEPSRAKFQLYFIPAAAEKPCP